MTKTERLNGMLRTIARDASQHDTPWQSKPAVHAAWIALLQSRCERVMNGRV